MFFSAFFHVLTLFWQRFVLATKKPRESTTYILLIKYSSFTILRILRASGAYGDRGDTFNQFKSGACPQFKIFLVVNLLLGLSSIKLMDFFVTKPGVFYNVKNGSSFITSKSSSDNLSNHKKHLCFCCLLDKTWIKMPKWTIFLISSKVFVLITEIFWLNFWRNKWQSLFDVVKDSS